MGEQSQEIKALRREIDSLRAQLEDSTSSLASISSKSKRRAAASTLEGSDQVTQLGKKFAIVQSLWLDPKVFDLPRDDSLSPDSPERFKTKISYEKGILSVLYNLFPKTMHDNMVDVPAFRNVVRLAPFYTTTSLQLITTLPVH